MCNFRFAMHCQCCEWHLLQHRTGSCCRAGWVQWRTPTKPSMRILHVHPYQASELIPTIYTSCDWTMRERTMDIMKEDRMIKNMLKRRKESDTYQATVCRHHWSRQITIKNRAFSQHCGFHQLKRATVLAESSCILSIFIMICLLQLCLLTVVR